jgi:hypothetical protein
MMVAVVLVVYAKQIKIAVSSGLCLDNITVFLFVLQIVTEKLVALTVVVVFVEYVVVFKLVLLMENV